MKKYLYVFVVLAFVACQPANKEKKSGQDQPANAELVETIVNVGGMHCDMCVNSIEKGVNELEGISFVKANLEDSTAVVKYDASKTDLAHIEAAIEKRGYSIKKGS
ncbi:copper ion binding protein [Maribellus comscasis]|uniref:Copper ion binding protein n=1 Tax=Maribellus comscasis TaxID=2681766 RepID=A0A6I6JSC9_9BACT|nr:heavy-metal-associated domain-containing protein [Maribellus comscasis]QGY45351.1 copper ion binding protein [Maribellus comscasis]